MSRLIKKKVIILNVGEKIYRYTEIMEEIVEQQPRETIDLTLNEEEESGNSPAHWPRHTPNGTPYSPTQSDSPYFPYE